MMSLSCLLRLVLFLELSLMIIIEDNCNKLKQPQEAPDLDKGCEQLVRVAIVRLYHLSGGSSIFNVII